MTSPLDIAFRDWWHFPAYQVYLVCVNSYIKYHIIYGQRPETRSGSDYSAPKRYFMFDGFCDWLADGNDLWSRLKTYSNGWLRLSWRVSKCHYLWAKDMHRNDSYRGCWYSSYCNSTKKKKPSIILQNLTLYNARVCCRSVISVYKYIGRLCMAYRRYQATNSILEKSIRFFNSYQSLIGNDRIPEQPIHLFWSH